MVESAKDRLKNYIEKLTNEIVSIVEKESDQFLEVASKLDGFKQILADLKMSHEEFEKRFKNEAQQTKQIYNLLAEH